MKFVFALATIATFLATTSVAAPAAAETSSVQACGFPTVPLFHVYSATQSDRLFTTDPTEVERALESGVYISSSLRGYIYSESTGSRVPGAVPFYQVYSAAQTDHFLTTSWDEVESAVNNKGDVYQGIVGYVYPQAQAGCPEAMPFYRLFHPTTPLHLYTLSVAQKNDAVSTRGYIDEGVAAYVLPPPQ